MNILIINEEGDCYLYPFGFDKRLNRTIVLAYRLKNKSEKNNIVNEPTESVSSASKSNTDRIHYDSVVRIEQTDIFSISKLLAQRKIFRTELTPDKFIEQ